MWVSVIVAVSALAYVGYRLSLSVRSARARRAGDVERADALSMQGRQVFLGVASAVTSVAVVVVIVVSLTR